MPRLYNYILINNERCFSPEYSGLVFVLSEGL